MKRKVIRGAMALFILLAMVITQSISVSAAASKFVTSVNTTSKVVALTFDDGADGANTNKILDILAKNNVKATFFLTGSGANNHPQYIKNIAAKGHQLGNHSYTHPDFTKLTATQMKSELDRTEALIKSLTGKTTKPIFRAPFGAVNSTVLSGVGAAGYGYTIQWNIDTIDWKGLTASQINTKVQTNIKPGSIVLMHTGAGAPGTPLALPTMISQLKAKGYKFVTVSQLLAYQNTSTNKTYTVKSGDTLYSIARTYGVTVSALAAANNITNYSLIYVGQVLIIPGTTVTPPPSTTVKYTVKSGDTLYKIATMYNTTVAKIAAANNITNVNSIYVGQVLIIPTTTVTPPTTTVKYTVKSGDTLYKIATMYNTTVAKIAAANNITNVNSIYVGQVLTIPK
ncbi:MULTISPECIES: LysM peptidoglycan-binding domain-containing protein [unclassified Exiguobacterium]|uniref:LysM peptidoglycan-binding domain-containing protein n=1 Tax=unclassified Exiguobacterium TaxID=2644629 RepID=UPI001BE52E91|nr:MULTISPECIES: LysM peptidoglycan-binding domain-containing protein [unclassified Exiguobacterium]MDT0193047.1 LysM peptidoglycan-binding domain-containing protein [Exiguobacterium sp. BG5(2022)]